MMTRIQKNGNITIPTDTRSQMNWEPGDKLLVSETDSSKDQITIKRIKCKNNS